MDVLLVLESGGQRHYPGIKAASFELDGKMLRIIVDDVNMHWWNMESLWSVQVFDPAGFVQQPTEEGNE